MIKFKPVQLLEAIALLGKLGLLILLIFLFLIRSFAAPAATTANLALEEQQLQEEQELSRNSEIPSENIVTDLPVPDSNDLTQPTDGEADKNKLAVKPESKIEELTTLTVSPKSGTLKLVATRTEKTKPKTKQQTAKKIEVKSTPKKEDEQSDAELAQEPTAALISDSLVADSLPKPTGVILFAENEQIKITLSNKDVNRIAVTNDKIQSLNGPTGLYTAKNDPLGSAYLGVNVDHSFTLFVSTIKGHQFSLRIKPKAGAGKTVVLTPRMPAQITASWAPTEGYQKLIVALISSMINNEPCQDYAYVPIKRPQTHNFYKVAQIKPVGYYLGVNLIGLISVIKNSTKQPLTLKPASFYTSGVRAVALATETLAPKASGLLYQVIGK